MSENDFDYGPLAGLIGVWTGDKGMDIAPEPDGTEHNPYYETITYTAIGDADNAEEQLLTALHYIQIVQRKSNDEVFHHQSGYWMWDAKLASLCIRCKLPVRSRFSQAATITAKQKMTVRP
ncbi:MAG: heme-binding beta-barrel domain-containing protein [Alphaproteobacteria bacterium]